MSSRVSGRDKAIIAKYRAKSKVQAKVRARSNGRGGVRDGEGIRIKRYGENNFVEDVSKKAKDNKVSVEDDDIKEEFRGDEGALSAVAAASELA